ncbi:hypothetical protein QWZ13_03080 [Reinekea marina]|nr:hypothetical protein [Reinekea marina]MDN3647894.1 hypothetical protein [Reinekea marina]
MFCCIDLASILNPFSRNFNRYFVTKRMKYLKALIHITFHHHLSLYMVS